MLVERSSPISAGCPSEDRVDDTVSLGKTFFSSCRSLSLKVVTFLSTLTVSGCKSDSSLKTERGRSELRPNWLLSWNGFLLPTTAVNVAKETWFVGENDMVLSFDGWQLTRINNLMPTGINVTIELEESNMVIKGNDIDVVTYKCDEWAKKNMVLI